MNAIKKFVENNKALALLLGSLAAAGSIAIFVLTTRKTRKIY